MGTLVAFAVVVWLAVHSRAVQTRAWAAVAERLEAATGLEIEATSVRLRVLPARLTIRDLALRSEHGAFLSCGEVVVGWSWTEVLGTPPRLRRVVIEDPHVDLDRLPSVSTADADGDAVDDVWRIVEIDRLEVLGGKVTGDVDAMEVSASGLALGARLTAGALDASASLERLAVTRAGRTLEGQRLELEVEGSRDRGLTVRRLEGSGPAFALSGRGSVTADPLRISVPELTLEVDLGAAAQWWNPSVQEQFDLGGRLTMGGEVVWGVDGGLELDVRHLGDPVEVAGFTVDRLAVSSGADGLAVEADGPWGHVTGSGWVGRTIQVEAQLREQDVRPVLDRVAVSVPSGVRGPIRARGVVDLSITPPYGLRTAEGHVDLEAATADGRLAVRGHGRGGAWDLDSVVARIADASLEGSGRLSVDGVVAGSAVVDIPDPEATMAAVARWVPESVLALGPAGGPVHGVATVRGTFDAPDVEATVVWAEPEIAGAAFRRLELEVTSEEGRVVWSLSGVDEAGAGLVVVDGVTSTIDLATSGEWNADVDDLGRLVESVGQAGAVPGDLAGRVEGRGTWSLAGGRWAVGGTVRASNIVAHGWSLDSVTAAFDVDPGLLRVPDLQVRGFGGRLAGTVSMPLDPLSGEAVDVGLVLEGLDTAELPVAVPWWGEGTVSADLALSGPATAPVGEMRVAWSATYPEAPLIRGAVDLAVRDGVVTAVGDGLESAGGPLELRVDLPLGDVPRPAWLWADARGGVVRVGMFAEALDVAPFAVAYLDQEAAWRLTTNAELAVRWDLHNPQARVGELRLADVVFDNAIETLRSEGPIVVEVDGSQAIVRSARLRSERSDIQLSGQVAFDTGALDVTGQLALSPELVRLLPLPARARGAILADFDLGGTFSAPTGRLELDHRGGAIVMRDPPIELLDTRLVAVLDEGVVWIEEGSASLNRGRVEIGGGWDPVSGQGLVAQLEDVVMVLPMSILTRWSGEIALEPTSNPDRIATAVGELTLESGLWDRPFDYTGVLLDSGGLGTAGDDPLYQIGLDVRVRGRGGVRVDNNLGAFDVAWDTLRVGGTAAEPQIVGEMRLEPGGRLELPGRTVTIRRGTVQFTGNTESDPLLEIVPVEDVARFASGEDSGGLDVGMLATQGLASSVGTALGFENRTLTPEEIAVETETNTATRFSIGQRLSRNLALFFSTDLADPQASKTQLQLWNLSWAPGLAVQVYDDTGEDDTGLNVIQRFRWGGTKGDDDTPVIQTIRLEGEWPVSKRRARRSTGLAKGQPYDPFMLFVAGLRMERELAENGYQLARVEGWTEGPDNLPALVFRCEPGPRQPVVFEGQRPPRRVRREVTALYQPPPLEGSSLAAMEDLLARHVRSEGYIDAKIQLERRGEAIVATVELGDETELSGPMVDGVPDDVAVPIRRVLGTPVELARALDDPDRAEQIVRRLLYGAGYHEATLRRVWQEPTDAGEVLVHLDVEPGPRAMIAEIVVDGLDPLGLVSAGRTDLTEGMPFDRGAIDRVLSEIRSAYVESGWRSAEVRARTVELDLGMWRLDVRIDPGARRTVREIDITGERHVRDRYLRHGITLEPGAVLAPSDLDESVVDVAVFPPVERVEVRTTPVDAEQVDVEFAITERSRWTVELGAGWNSDSGAVVQYGLRDDNLFGRGFSLNLRGQWQQDQNLVLLYAILPPLPGDRLTLSSTIRWYDGDLRIDPDNFFQQRLSGSIEANYRLGTDDLLRAYIERARSEQTFKNRDNPIADLLDSIGNESILGLQFVRDRFDNPFDPKSGYSLAVDLSANMPELGSDLADIRALGRGGVAIRPFTRGTWVQAARLGWAEGRQGDELIPDRRFFAGGQASIRGFDRDSVGPTRPALGGLAPAGGGALLILNEELRVRLWGQVGVAVFVDAGQVWESWTDADLALAVGAGLGVRISTPIGPVWADVAWPLANVGELTTSGPKYYLGIGRPF
jgi:translocation and assembly module TamA